LASHHFEEARTVHADGLAVVGSVFHGGELPGFVDRAAQGDSVVMVERQMIKALREDKHFRNAVAACADNGSVVAAGAGVSFGGGNAVKIPGKQQRGAGVGDARASAFGHGAASAFLSGELGGEELPAVFNQLRQWNVEFVAVFKMRGDGEFAPDLQAGILP